MTAAPRRRRRVRRAAAALSTVAILILLAGVPATVGTQLALAAPPSTVPMSVIDIGTVPAVAGFPVTLDGVTTPTDATGHAHFFRPATLVELRDRITLTTATLPIGGRRVQVTATRLFRFPAGPQLALDLRYPVSFQFSIVNGPSLDTASIKTILVKSTTGAVEELPAHQQSWLQAVRAIPKAGALAVKGVDWRVLDVTFAGSNVVNSSQQLFRPAQQSNVDVKLLFYGMRLQLRDALFGFPRRGAVELAYPDHHTRRLPLDSQGRLSITALPRGAYTLTPLGPGPKMSHPLAISRDQDLQVEFFSWLDIGTVGGILLVVALALAWAGRRRRRSMNRGRQPTGHRRRAHRPARPRATGKSETPDAPHVPDGPHAALGHSEEPAEADLAGTWDRWAG